MRGPLRIAAAQPVCAAKDVRANALTHAHAVREADARVVAFPELSLTGYELDAPPVPIESELLAPVVAACAETGSVALVGAPVAAADGRMHIGTLRVSAEGVEIAYRKRHLGGDEPRRFSPGEGPVALTVDGWRIGLGICKDTGVAEHVAAIANLGIDLYVAGVCHLPEELEMQEERAARIARACSAHVAIASFAGGTGAPFESTAGVSSIWAPDGTPIARAGADPGEVVGASIA